ncbi:hypothetical protein [Paracoccus shandongensis]|uniref:hypothetical protein n=1 Tax=Paracoccus shandongensis TaxID=2816048 RepID=UPI001A8CDC7B|nr:hypothetical protein [Paracoccus shandongensis]
MQPAVRYSPDVESPSPDGAATIRDLSDALRGILETTSRDYGHAVRAVHAKSHGIIRGARRQPYRMSAAFRSDVNGCPIHEPAAIEGDAP